QKPQCRRQHRRQRLDAELDDDEVEAPDGNDDQREKNVAERHQAACNRARSRGPKTLTSRPMNTTALPASSSPEMPSPSNRAALIMPATGTSSENGAMVPAGWRASSTLHSPNPISVAA